MKSLDPHFIMSSARDYWRCGKKLFLYLRKPLLFILFASIHTLVFSQITGVDDCGCDDPDVNTVTFCHRTNSATNPFVEITTNCNGLNGHTNAQHAEDHCGPCTCEELNGPCVDPNPDDCIGNYAYDENCECVGTPIPDCGEDPVCCEGETQFCHVQSGTTITINGNNCEAHIDSDAPGHDGDHCGPCTCEEENGPCVDPNLEDCIGNYAYDENCECVGTPIPDCGEDPVCCEGETQFCHVQSGTTITINGNNCEAHIDSDAPGHDGDHCGPCTCEEENGPCVDPNLEDCIGNYAYNENCECVGTPIPDCGGCDMVGAPCDTDPCLLGQVYDADCNCSGGTPNPDCVDDGCPVEGNACNDGDSCTKDDKYNADCECVGVPDNEDYDSDGTINCMDGCPFDRDKTSPGVCGCGIPESGDSDGDGIPDCNDPCPNGAVETEPGYCSCGVPAIHNVRLINRRNCSGNGTSDGGDDTFMADLKVNFYSAPTSESVRVRGDATGRLDFSADNTQTEFIIEGLTFKADGKRLTIIVEYIGLESCRFTVSNIQALSPCSMPPCTAPSRVKVDQEYGLDAVTVSWKGDKDDMIYDFEYRKNGGAWESKVVESAAIRLDGLGFNEGYEYQVRALCCSSDWSSYRKGTFKTKSANGVSSCVMVPYVTNVTCVNSHTPSTRDDYLRFQLKISGTPGNSYRFPEGVLPRTGEYNKVNYFQTISGAANGNTFNLELVDNQKSHCRTSIEIETPENCAQNCNITGIFVENLQRCYGNTTGGFLKYAYLEADVRVTFQNVPAGGTLQLAEGALAIVNVGSLGSTESYTFKKVRLNYGEPGFKIMAAFVTGTQDILWGGKTSCSAFIENIFPCLPCPIDFCESPTALNASVSGREATVYWDELEGNRFYEVAYRVGKGNWHTKKVLTNITQLEGLKPSADYEFKVRAYCSNNNWSAYTNSSFATTAFQEIESRGADVIGQHINQFVHYYPNPATSTLILDYSIPETIDFNKSVIKVYDLLGQVKISKKLEAQESILTLDLNHLNNGIYMLTLNMNGLIFTGKILKEDMR